MMTALQALHLLIFDTNIIVDIWLGRDNDQAVLLLKLAEERRVDLVVPEYALMEFRGTALRWLRDQKERLDRHVRGATNEWERSNKLSEPAETLRDGCQRMEKQLEDLRGNIDGVIAKIRDIATIASHTPDIHFKGDLRYLQGLPPDRPVDGLKDCRIYEAVLEIVRSDQEAVRPTRYFVTRDSDFDYRPLTEELAKLGVTVWRGHLGKLYGTLTRAASQTNVDP